MIEDTLQLTYGDVLAMLKKTRGEIYDEVVAAMRELGAEAAHLAKSKAAGQGFAAPGKSGRGTGRLLDSITSTTHGLVAYVREGAVSTDPYNGRDSSRHTYPGGYPYPAIFEFGRKEAWMNRPFLFPALNELEPEAVRRVEDAVDRALAHLQA